MPRSLFAIFVLVSASVFGCKSTPEHSVAVGGKCEKDVDCIRPAECVALGSDTKICTKTCNEQMAKMVASEGCPAPMKCEEIEYTQKAGTKVLGTVKRKMCIP